MNRFPRAVETRQKGPQPEAPAALSTTAGDGWSAEPSQPSPSVAQIGDPHPTGEVLAEAWFESQAERVERVVFWQGRLGMGYSEDEVDTFLDRIVATLRGTTDSPVSAAEVRSATFATVMLKPGYATAEVDAFLTEIADVLEHLVDK